MIDLVNGNLITNHENLRKSFFNTAYIITAGKVGFNLKIGVRVFQIEKLLKRERCNHWIYITAHNPFSKRRTESENIKSDLELKSLVKKKK